MLRAALLCCGMNFVVHVIIVVVHLVMGDGTRALMHGFDYRRG